MIAVGVRRARSSSAGTRTDSRRTSSIRPAFTLTIFSLALIVTGASDITWGQDIAITQFYPPHMYLFLFLVALPGQFLFGVTTMTMAAVVTTYLFGLAYYALTGTYYFFDSYIPIAVFLGMHLLFTDPSTAPRTELGRHDLRRALWAQHDRAVCAARRRRPSRRSTTSSCRFRCSTCRSNRSTGSSDPRRCGGSIRRRSDVRSLVSRRNLAYMSVWAIVFAIMSAAQGVGDRHRGQWIPFWQQACQQDRVDALPVSCPAARDLLPRRLPAGRATSWAFCRPTRRWIGRARSRRWNGAASLAFSPRAPTPPTWRATGIVVQRISLARGAANSPAREQRADHRSECRVAVLARLRPGLARQL